MRCGKKTREVPESMLYKGQQNIKVHLAGMEETMAAQMMHEAAGFNYALFSVLSYIGERAGIKAVSYTKSGIKGVKMLESEFRHVIMDSGLFSLMFGAHAAPRDEKFVSNWTEYIIEFVEESGFGGTVVECDCQKILGPKQAWKYRQRMKDRLPNRIMNVWHWEDGHKGLDRMIEFSEYIALSLPELRALKKTKHAVALANYIKNKKPSIDIHLLGTCANNYLSELRFCTSADSTNWQEVNRWGHLAYNNGKDKAWHVHNSQIKEDDWKPYVPYVEKILPEWGREVNDQRREYYSKFMLAGVLLHQQYSIHGGPQD